MESLRAQSRQQNIDELRRFITESERLPRRSDAEPGKKLFLWISRQRTRSENGTLPADLADALRGLQINPLEAGDRLRRRKYLERLQEFHTRNGRWPGHSEDQAEQALYRSVVALRTRLKTGHNVGKILSELQGDFTQIREVLLLEDLHSGFDSSFLRQLDRVAAFHDEHGRLPVVNRLGEENSLARWFRAARQDLEAGNLSGRRSEALKRVLATVTQAAPAAPAAPQQEQLHVESRRG